MRVWLLLFALLPNKNIGKFLLFWSDTYPTGPTLGGSEIYYRNLFLFAYIFTEMHNIKLEI